MNSQKVDNLLALLEQQALRLISSISVEDIALLFANSANITDGKAVLPWRKAIEKALNDLVANQVALQKKLEVVISINSFKQKLAEASDEETFESILKDLEDWKLQLDKFPGITPKAESDVI